MTKLEILSVAAKANGETKHTPGPWSVSTDPCVPGRIIVERRSDGRKSFIAEVHRILGHGGTAEANANLIAAATELLRALDAARMVIEILDADLTALGRGRNLSNLPGFEGQDFLNALASIVLPHQL